MIGELNDFLSSPPERRDDRLVFVELIVILPDGGNVPRDTHSTRPF